jgi:hypothetical protein
MCRKIRRKGLGDPELSSESWSGSDLLLDCACVSLTPTPTYSAGTASRRDGPFRWHNSGRPGPKCWGKGGAPKAAQPHQTWLPGAYDGMVFLFDDNNSNAPFSVNTTGSAGVEVILHCRHQAGYMRQPRYESMLGAEPPGYAGRF